MNNPSQGSESRFSQAATLRRQAEAIAGKKAVPLPENFEVLGLAEARRMLHELRVHQIELEMQNEALRQSEMSLGAARTRYFDLYDLAPVGYCTLDDQGLILEANLTAATLLGVVREGLVKQPFHLLVFPADQDHYYLCRETLAATGALRACELRMVKADGTTFWAHLDVAVATNAAGGPECRVVIHDITERKRVEAELQNMQKLQSLGTLAGGIAHDFNNIMTGVFGNIALAKDQLTNDHPGYARLAEAENSMNRAIGLTKQLLTFAKGGAPVRESVCLGTLVEEVARANLVGSPVTLAHQQDHGLWAVNADPWQLRQVVANLIINARQAMPEGGRLSVVMENVELGGAAISGLRQGQYVKVVIHDEGVGIDPKLLDRIFDPYFTTKATGNGLGLATAYSVINRHGGHLGVESALGQGSTFTVHLPAAKSPPVAAVPPPAAARPPPAAARPPPAAARPLQDRAAHILVMDDELMIQCIVVHMLTRHGLSVATATEGQEAITMYQQAMADGTPFDVVILDLTIPGGMGGQEAILKLRQLDPKVRAIVSSGYADSPVMAHHADYGFKGALAKPYTQNKLHDVVMRVLNGIDEHT